MQRTDGRPETSRTKSAPGAGGPGAESGPGVGPAEAAGRPCAPHVHRCIRCGVDMSGFCVCDARTRAAGDEVLGVCHACYMRTLDWRRR